MRSKLRLSAGVLFAVNSRQSRSPKPVLHPTTGRPASCRAPISIFQAMSGGTYRDSDPAQFPQLVQAPKGAPDAVLVVIDDAGFGEFNPDGFMKN